MRKFLANRRFKKDNKATDGKPVDDEQETTEPTSCLCLRIFNWRLPIFKQTEIMLGKFIPDLKFAY